MKKNLGVLTFILFSLCLGLQRAASAEGPASEQGIGYPSVAAALDALKDKPGVKISVQGGWTIIEDPSDPSLWSFAPSGHPAFPAAVKRKPVKQDGGVSMEMSALCQAPKEACDKLIGEFQELNERIRASIEEGTKTSQVQWAPSEKQKAAALRTLSRFHIAMDEARLRDAYGMFTAGMKNVMSVDTFIANSNQTRTDSGGSTSRGAMRITWYKDPPNASAPGVFAAFDIRCSAPRLAACEEIVILHEEADGEFRVMRTERNMFRDKNDRTPASQWKQRAVE